VSELLPRIQSDLNAARKAQDRPLTLVLGTALSELKNRQLELARDVSDDEAVEVIRKAIKRRRESVEMYASAGRDELAARERDELAVLERYLPPQVPDDEIRAAVQAAIAGGATNVGAVMGKVMPQFRGRAEGGTINAVVREELAKAAPR
jgi:uncharacterized protein YqeY